MVNTHNLNTQDAEAKVQGQSEVYGKILLKNEQKAQECTVWTSGLISNGLKF